MYYLRSCLRWRFASGSYKFLVMHIPVIGISCGDPNGVGPEVILKSLQHPGVLKLLTPVIYAPAKMMAEQKKALGLEYRFRLVEGLEKLEAGHIYLAECGATNFEMQPGHSTAEGGRLAAESLERSVADLKAGRIHALVTAPINKANMPKDTFPFPGHTEFLTSRLGAPKSLMFLVNDGLRVGLVTNHVPVAKVAEQITVQLILDKIAMMDRCLRRDFGIEKPLIAVLALNPHAGDSGVIGDEDDKIIRPAILEAKNKGHLVLGPYPADGFFGSGKHQKVDAILAMYHDQGLVPFKALSFGEGVNFTAGLPSVRTSPDHGTAYDIAGKGIADPSSFIQALFLAQTAIANRRRYDEDNANPLVHTFRSPKKKTVAKAGGEGKSKGSDNKKG